MTADSARSQPPIDTTIVTDTCVRCGGEYRELAGEWRLRQCMSCGDLTVATPALRITGPDLIAVIKAMAHYWRQLGEIEDSHYFMLEDGAEMRSGFGEDDDPTWAELYEGQAQALARDIGELRIGGEV